MNMSDKLLTSINGHDVYAPDTLGTYSVPVVIVDDDNPFSSISFDVTDGTPCQETGPVFATEHLIADVQKWVLEHQSELLSSWRKGHDKIIKLSGDSNDVISARYANGVMHVLFGDGKAYSVSREALQDNSNSKTYRNDLNRIGESGFARPFIIKDYGAVFFDNDQYSNICRKFCDECGTAEQPDMDFFAFNDVC